MTIKKYPSSFPTPTVQNYNIAVDMGIVRTRFDTGVNRQRRRYRTMPHLFNFTFAMPIVDLDTWQMWADEYAYQWFEIPAASYLTGMAQNDKNCSPHVVRFVSDLQITPLSNQSFAVTVVAEMAPTSKYSRPGILTDKWIIAGDPATPSPDWIIAGNPDLASPSTDWINPGSPEFPAAII